MYKLFGIRRDFRHFLLLLAIGLSSCSPATETVSVTATPATNNTAAAETPLPPSAILETNLRYEDPADDMSTSFLDVTDFQATVDENNTLEVVLKMRDIPLTAERGGTRNVAEYSVLVTVYLDPQTAASTASPDFQIMAVAATFDPPDPSNQSGILIPKPGETTVFPMDKFWSYGSVSDLQIGDTIANFEPLVDPEADTLTLRARIPGITSSAVVSYTARHYPDEVDRPDSAEASGPALVAGTDVDPTSPTPPALNDPGQLVQASSVHAYPGPAHYEGDMLTFEIQNFDGIPESEQKAILKLDEGEPFEMTGTWSFYNVLILPLAFDTSGLSGRHTLHISTPDGNIDEAYTFEVLPASQRPTQEQNTAWMMRTTQCCTFHYISNTAAERDAQFIDDHFQNAANEFSQITGKNIEQRMDIYLIDRLVGNGGFGGNGKLVISYTDRYYGPTVGAESLETLARHEFTHAVGVGLEASGDGIDFNYEGLAVYVAGGHYKPEPLTERGAALYDLGYFVPVGQFLEQHELSYLYSAAILTYIVDVYGKDALWKFLEADNDPSDGQPGPIDIAIQNTFSITKAQFEEGFRTWLQDHDSGNQLDDLRLTIKLQDLRRQYQETYAPPPYLILENNLNNLTRPEFIPLIMREPQAPANVALEILIANGQAAIVAGDYPAAEQIINTVENILATGSFQAPEATDYLAAVTTLMENGYSVDLLQLSDNKATTQVSKDTPALLTIQLQKSAIGWVILP